TRFSRDWSSDVCSSDLYDLDATQVRPGDSLELRFYWRAAATPEADYSLFIHLTASDEVAPLAQVDGAPARVERLTLTWDDPDEEIGRASCRERGAIPET